MDPKAVSSSYILARPQVSEDLVSLGRLVGAHEALVADSSEAGRSETVLDKGRARIRMGLGHRPYRLAHRTPVLYSRNQSRTNIALSKKWDRRGRVSLPSCSI